MQPVVILGKEDKVVQRPFTHPELISADAAILRYLVRQLQLMVDHPSSPSLEPRTVCLQTPGVSDWEQRVVLVQPKRLQALQQIVVVGFFGQRRESADVNTASNFDTTLLKEFSLQPDLLSYSTTLLACGNYANLVLFASEEGIMHWSRSMAHAQAASQFAPNYYETVRIYNGCLPAGIVNGDQLRLQKAKYFDYTVLPLWNAVRQIEI